MVFKTLNCRSGGLLFEHPCILQLNFNVPNVEEIGRWRTLITMKGQPNDKNKHVVIENPKLVD